MRFSLPLPSLSSDRDRWAPLPLEGHASAHDSEYFSNIYTYTFLLSLSYAIWEQRVEKIWGRCTFPGTRKESSAPLLSLSSILFFRENSRAESIQPFRVLFSLLSFYAFHYADIDFVVTPLVYIYAWEKLVYRKRHKRVSQQRLPHTYGEKHWEQAAFSKRQSCQRERIFSQRERQWQRQSSPENRLISHMIQGDIDAFAISCWQAEYAAIYSAHAFHLLPFPFLLSHSAFFSSSTQACHMLSEWWAPYYIY